MPQEKKDPSDEDKIWRSKILDHQLGAIDAMLVSDERNFHAWNLRLWAVDTYLGVIERRARDKSAYFQQKFLKGEVDMAYEFISSNFSNYSAWHYRGMIMRRLYKH